MKNYPWYSETTCEKMHDKFMQDHPEKDMDYLRDMAMVGSLDDFRTLCNCLYVNEYHSDAFYSMKYDESRELCDLCNSRIHAMLGDRDEIYNHLFKVWKSERWGGDETWKLFCDACKPYNEAQAILTVIDLGRYLGQTLTFENLPKVHDLYAHGRYWDLYVEDSYSFDIDIPSEFKESNRRRKEHTHRWRKFMAYIWEGDFDSGRQMLDQYDKEKAAHVEECRRKNGK